jgi:membrane protease subunit HflK
MRERLYLDAMQQILSSTSKIMVDAKAGTNLLYLPLDKIIQMSGAGTQREPVGAPTQPTEAAPPVSGARSRDTLRPREREGRP